MYFFVPETLKAVHDMGIRVVLPYLGMDFFDDKNTESALQQAIEYMETPLHPPAPGNGPPRSRNHGSREWRRRTPSRSSAGSSTLPA